jgi:predicted acetyltransferase
MEGLIEAVPLRGADLAELKSVWNAVFGDDEEYISLFFSALEGHVRAYGTRRGGKLAAAGYSLDTGSIVFSGGEIPFGYLYALATLPEHRGSGLAAKIVRRILSEDGVSALVPAEKSLFSYYERFGYRTAFYTAKSAALPRYYADFEREAVGAEQYSALREKYLSGRAHVRLNKTAASYFETLMKLSGGGLYKLSLGTSEAVAACEISDGRLIIKELLSLEDEPKPFAEALCASFSLPCCEYFYPHTKKHPEEKIPFGMLCGADAPDDIYFGPAFD